MRRLLPLLLLLACARPAAAQVDAEILGLFGGTWQADCAKPASAKVTVSANAIVFVDGARRVAATTATAAASWYGNSAPEGHLMTFVGDMPDGDQVIVDVLEDAQGRYAHIDGGGSVRKALGPAALKLRLVRCGAAVVKAKVVAPAQTAPGLPGPAELAADPAFAAPYRKALGKLAKEDWLLRLEGPAPESGMVTVAGTEYRLLHACKAHDCADNNTTLLWNAPKRLVYGKVRLAGRSALVGNPPPAVAKELGEFWRKQWGAQP
jgi:hypothetical protein